MLVGLDRMPESILLWRAVMQWLGGIGIIVMAIAILPWLRTGGMQLFRAESSDRSDKPMARMARVTAAICLAYLVLTLACAMAFWAAGMTPFEAVSHSMATLATGGFSTSDASLGSFPPATHWVAIAFMIAGALPFLLFVRAARGDFVNPARWPDAHDAAHPADRRSDDCGLAPVHARPPVRRCVPRRRVQRHLGHDHDRLCLRGLRPLGAAPGRDLLLSHVRGRLRRLELGRNRGYQALASDH